MPRRFFREVPGGDEEPHILFRPRLPRFFFQWGDYDRVTEIASTIPAEYHNNVWLVKFRVLEATFPDGKTVVHDDNFTNFAIGTNTFKILKRWHPIPYWIDLGENVPAVPGTSVKVRDKNGADGVIDILAEPVPAPWWVKDRNPRDVLYEKIEDLIGDFNVLLLREVYEDVAEYVAEQPYDEEDIPELPMRLPANITVTQAFREIMRALDYISDEDVENVYNSALGLT